MALPKNDKPNVSAAEVKALKRLASTLLAFDDAALTIATAAGELIEVITHD